MKKQKLLMIATGFLSIILAISICCTVAFSPKIKLLKDTSCFITYMIQGDKIKLEYSLTFENTFDKDKVFTINAKLPIGVQSGLLKNPNLKIDSTTSNSEFFIPKKSAKSYNITFIGDFGGTTDGQINKLPDINITIKD